MSAATLTVLPWKQSNFVTRSSLTIAGSEMTNVFVHPAITPAKNVNVHYLNLSNTKPHSQQ